MKNTKKFFAALSAGLLLAQSAALADTISFNGAVGAADTIEVYAPIGGTVADVQVEVGQSVQQGDVLATLRTTRVYATEDGVVTGIFAQPGDSAETIASRYGAVLYIEGETVYTISASTDKAYDATENKFVHVGEEVLLVCYSDGDHTGTGVITAISGTDYTVEVTEGEFLIGETVNIYRTETGNANRIGRGTLSRRNPTAVTGSGSIVSIAVKNGDTVSRGDLLFETLTGSFDGLYMSGSEITATADGMLAKVNMEQGGKLEKDGVAAVLYAPESMRIEAEVLESDLGYIAVGDTVSVELTWDENGEAVYEGTISMISGIATESAQSDGVTYTVYIDFTPDATTRYGMSAIVTTLEEPAE